MNLLAAIRRRVKRLGFSARARRHELVGPPELWKMKRDFQIGFLRDAGLEPQHTLLDLGCGTLRGGIPLIDYLHAGHYVGLDTRQEALAEARKELREAGLEHKHPELVLSADLSSLDLNRKFDFIWAFSVLIHLNDEILDSAIGFVARHLGADGVFFANVNTIEREEGKWLEFPVVSRSLEFYRQVCARHGLGMTSLGPIRNLGHVSGREGPDSQEMLRISPDAG